jgi:ArsR family transcriptional regulator
MKTLASVRTQAVIYPSHHVDISRQMDETAAINALTALAQPTRMSVFRNLVRLYPEALPAGDLARLCGAPHNTMSTHLAILKRAGLIAVRKESRSMLCRADIDGLRGLMTFLARDCCGGHPEICAPILGDDIVACSCETESADG